MKKSFFNPTEEFVDKLVEVIDGRMVIEIGCGKGELLKALLDKGVKAIGIDPFVDPSTIDRELSAKVLPYEIDRVHTLLREVKTEKVFLVARPCHSAFPQDYLRLFGDDSEMIYIGFAKNLEIDFEREISLIREIKFPDHEDCNIVAVLKNGNFDQSILMSNQWEKIDRRAQQLKGEVDQELLNWFIDLNKEFSYRKYNELIDTKVKEAYPTVDGLKGSSMGGNWAEYKHLPLLSRDITKVRKVTLDIATYMVGGGHFSCRIHVEDENFVEVNEDGTVSTRSPWDREEGKPDFVEHYNDDRTQNLTWYGIRDNKRTADLESGLIWLKESFKEMQKLYMDKLGITLYPDLDGGLIYELEELMGIEINRYN